MKEFAAVLEGASVFEVEEIKKILKFCRGYIWKKLWTEIIKGGYFHMGYITDHARAITFLVSDGVLPKQMRERCYCLGD